MTGTDTAATESAATNGHAPLEAVPGPRWPTGPGSKPRGGATWSWGTPEEHASEQVIRTVQLGLMISELPIDYRPRIGRSKLSPLADGLRHLRLLIGAAIGAPRGPLPGSER